MKIDAPVPLYPIYAELREFELTDYPQLQSYLNAGPDWRQQHLTWGAKFLKYIGRNKSEHTYTRFRNDVERFLLWGCLMLSKPLSMNIAKRTFLNT
tara:strand:+ start:6300 stop:6587 length:288 start_codon:yes stop_codon:yes gene_type:complete